MKSKLASGPHESHKDPHKDPQEENRAHPLAQEHVRLQPGGQNLLRLLCSRAVPEDQKADAISLT